MSESKPVDAIEVFDYGRPHGNAAFRGKRRQIAAYVKHLEEPIIVRPINGNEVRYPAGTKYLDLHLDSEPVDQLNGEKSAVIKTMLTASEDLEQLLEALHTRSRLKNVAFLSGTTNPELTHLLTRKLGFQQLDESQASIVDQIMDKGTDSVFATPEELEHTVPEIRKRLAKINTGGKYNRVRIRHDYKK